MFCILSLICHTLAKITATAKQLAYMYMELECVLTKYKNSIEGNAESAGVRKKKSSSKKSETSPIIMKSNFQELKSHYMDYKHIYTDGSKVDMKLDAQ